jgi:glycosyltransferase involved in cell wall biosynthesis
VISFIVPAYNEELELPATLEAIRAAAQHRKHEIIVVDDASTDKTATIAQSAGVKLVSINRRQIAAARNAGARASSGEILFFVDADTRINEKHVAGAVDAIEAGRPGGSARIAIGGVVPTWARISLKVFCVVYFALGLGAGAFLFTTRRDFDAVGGFDETLFIGEEVYFSLALRKLGRLKILREPVLTSGRKLRMYSAREVLGNTVRVLFRGPRAARSREGLHLWYDGKREQRSAFAKCQSGSDIRRDEWI